MILNALLLATWMLAAPPADPYTRQPVDVENYHFAITLSDTTDRIAGVATVRLRMLSAGVRTITLDLAAATPARQGRGMRVSAVTSGGRALAFTHEGDRLAITLDHASTAGEELELVVRYEGIPAGGLEI